MTRKVFISVKSRLQFYRYIWISNSYLIRQNLQGYRCKSGIAIFEWRVTWNYAYSVSSPLQLWKYLESYDFLSICWTPGVSGETYWYLCINIPGTTNHRMDSTLLETTRIRKLNSFPQWHFSTIEMNMS